MSFHHRSTFGNKRKSHKINGKSKPSSSSTSKSFGRIDENEKKINDKKRLFRHCNQFRDVGKAQRKATSKEKRKIHREKLIKNKLKYYGGKQIGGIPKVVVIIGLSPYSDTNKVKKHLLNYCNGNDDKYDECLANRDGKKQNFIFYECNDRNDIHSTLDICKIADIILLISSSKPRDTMNESDKLNDCMLGLDDKSSLFCSLIRNIGGGGQGGITIYGLYQPRFYKLKKIININNVN